MKRLLSVLMVLMLTVGALMIVPEGEGAPDKTRRLGRTLYVGPSNSTYTEIGYALDDAIEWDTIYVAPGTYTKGMMIGTNGITIVGNNTEGDVIVGQLGEGIASIHAKWVNVSGITITDDNNHIGLLSMVGAENVSVTDVRLITSKISEGLYIRNGKGLVFNNITVQTADKQSVRIIDSQNITFEDFEFSCNTSMGGCFELDTTDDIVLIHGDIKLGEDGTAIYNLAGADLVLMNVSANYTEKFIMMETGNISMYNMDIDPDDILMDVPDPIHKVESNFLRKILMTGEGPDGENIPLEGAELNITRDGRNIYSSGYYGGADPSSGIDGYFPEMFSFLSWEKVGGEEGYRNGTNKVEVWFEGDMVGEFIEEQVDANTTDDFVVTLFGIYNQIRSLEGSVDYEDGPLMGEPALNATVRVYGQNMTEIGNSTVNETGDYMIENIPVQANFTLVIVPVDVVMDGGDESGYIQFETIVNLSKNEVMNFTLDHYEYISGPIFGYVRYQDGPNDGLFCGGAEVRLYNLTGHEVGVVTTNTSGYYEFIDMPFGVVYEVRVTPPLHELGVNLEITGYLFWDGSAFFHNRTTMINASVKYYEHVEPIPPHPKVTILDANDEPVEGAQVEVTLDGATYRANTNQFGIATFEGLDMEDLPEGTEFKASKEGYDDIEWKQGDDIPAIREAEDRGHIWLIIILVLLVIVVIAAMGYLIFFKRSPDEIVEE